MKTGQLLLQEMEIPPWADASLNSSLALRMKVGREAWQAAYIYFYVEQLVNGSVPSTTLLHNLPP